MALPQREEFDLEGAADYLGCSVGDVIYYLDKGLLRLAVSTDHLWELYAVLFADLSSELQEELKSFYNPDGIDLIRIKISGSVNTIEPFPSSIYITHFQRNKVKDTVHELGEPIWIFQDLEGEELTIWTDKSPRAVWLYEEDGQITGTYLAKEELDRFSGRSVEQDTKPKPVFAVPPEKPNEQSWIIVKYANQFYEEFGEIPKPKAFAKYLEEHAKGEGFRIRSDEEVRNPDTKPSERYKYDLNDYGMSERSLGRALREYQIKDETTN